MSVTGGMTAAWLIARANDDVPVDVPRLPAREAAERELTKPMYHENDPNLLQRGLDRFWEWVGDLFDSASGAAPGGPLGLAVIAVVAVALIAALWWRLGTPRRTPTTGGDSLFGERTRSAAEHRAAADAHADAGRWNEAVQERMRAIVRSLEERALLDPRPGRTADEAAAEASRPMPGHAVELRSAAGTFDDVTYGGRTADEPAYLRVKELDTALESSKPILSQSASGAAE
ncbi:DUF4129 domain-containing protein [Streptomyces sp. NPDC059176]|uniref:DUF4129 domain-containing protein n=1 Tax=unclassified Streptomyces TaxID=2593676 RepID=UPI0036956F1C